MFYKINLIALTFICILLLGANLIGEDRDPFLSPFEPRKPVPKKTIEEIEPNKQVAQVVKISDLEEKYTIEIKKFLNTNQPEKADALLADLKKSIGEKVLSEFDKTQITDFEDQIKNFTKYKELIKTAKSLMTIDGKIILKDKKNMLLINSQPVTEGEDLMDILKLEASIYLDQIIEDSFTLRYKDIKTSFSLE